MKTCPIWTSAISLQGYMEKDEGCLFPVYLLTIYTCNCKIGSILKYFWEILKIEELQKCKKQIKRH